MKRTNDCSHTYIHTCHAQEQLQQQFIFLPARIKTCYLIAVLLRLIRQDTDSVAAAAAEDGQGGNGRKRRETAQEIICNEVAEEMEKRSGHMHKKNKNKKKKEPTEGGYRDTLSISDGCCVICASARPFPSPAKLLCDNLREHLQSLPADGGHPAQHGRGLRGAALHHDPEGEDAGAQQVQEHDL